MNPRQVVYDKYPKGKPTRRGRAAVKVQGGTFAAGDEQASSLERKFDYWFRVFGEGLPEPVSQFPFQGYKIDRSWPDLKIAVELNGGAGGGYGSPVVCHNCGSRVRARKKDGSLGREIRMPYPSHTGKGAERDARKGNSLIRSGWTFLTFTSSQIDTNPEDCIGQVAQEVRRRMAEGVPSLRSDFVPPPAEIQDLTEREFEILVLLAQGMTHGEAAYKLGIREKTVQNHAANIREKMRAGTVSAATARAVAWGWISPLDLGL